MHDKHRTPKSKKNASLSESRAVVTSRTASGSNAEMMRMLSQTASQQAGGERLVGSATRPETILGLQRTLGNRVVQRLLNEQGRANGKGPAQKLPAGQKGSLLQRNDTLKGAAAGGTTGPARTFTYPSQSDALNYMDSSTDPKVQKEWGEMKQMATGRSMGDQFPLLAHYCYGLATATTDEERKQVRPHMEAVAEKIAKVLVDRDLFTRNTGNTRDVKAAQQRIQKGEAKNYYFWSLTMNQAMEDSLQNEGVTLEGSAAGSLFNDFTFAQPNYRDLFRIVFEKMSGPYAKAAERVIKQNQARGESSVIKVFQYRGINKETAFYTEEWPNVKTSGLPYQFTIYLWSGAAKEGWMPAKGVYQKPEFKNVVFDMGAIQPHYTMPIGQGGDNAPVIWNFPDNDSFQQRGGLHKSGSGPSEPGHIVDSKAFSHLPVAYLGGDKLVGKSPTGVIFLMNKANGTILKFYAPDEEAAIAKHKQGK